MKRVKYHKLVEELRPTFVCQDLFCTEHMAGTSLSMSALSSLTCGEEPSLTILVLFTFHFLISLVPNPQPTCCQVRCLYMSWSQTCGLPRLRPCPWRTCRSPEDCPWAWTCLPECLPRLISASAVDPLSQQYQEFLSLSTRLPPRNCLFELTCEGCHPNLQAYAWCGYLQILGKRQQRQASPKVHFSAKPVISSDLSDQRWGTMSLRKKTKLYFCLPEKSSTSNDGKLSSKLPSS